MTQCCFHLIFLNFLAYEFKYVSIFDLWTYVQVNQREKKLEFLSLEKIVCKLIFSVSFIHQLLYFFIVSRYSQFVQGQNLKDSQCIVFAHHRPSAADLTRTQLRKFIIVTVCSVVQGGKQRVINKNIKQLLALSPWVCRKGSCLYLAQPSVFL